MSNDTGFPKQEENAPVSPDRPWFATPGTFDSLLNQLAAAHRMEIEMFKQKHVLLENEVARLKATPLHHVSLSEVESAPCSESNLVQRYEGLNEVARLKATPLQHISLSVVESTSCSESNIALGDEDVNEQGTLGINLELSVENVISTHGPENSVILCESSSSINSEQQPSSKTNRKVTQFLFGHEVGDSGVNLNAMTMRCIVQHNIFNIISGVVVVLNILLIGIEVQYGPVSDNLIFACEILSCTCTVYFLSEVLMRLCAYGWKYFTDPETYAWNIFEFLLVLVSTVDGALFLSLGGSRNSSISSLQTLKLIRVIRVFRVFRFFRPLARLAIMMTDAVKSLVWALLLLALIMYVFAVSITMFTSQWLSDLEHGDVDNQVDLTELEIYEIKYYWKDVWYTYNTLFESVMGGIHWHYAAAALLNVGAAPSVLFFIYIFFTVLAALNVITGICADNAFRSLENHRSFAVEHELETRQGYVNQITEIFHILDADGSGDVTTGELEELLGDPSLSAYFRVLGFDIHDANRFLRLMDTDNDGIVNFKEFLSGCMRFKGQASNLDVHALLYEQKRLRKKLDQWMSVVDRGCQN